MKKYFNKGFTLIELLIVIALLGALAVGLLAALDPFEQLKKGTDTGVRNTVSELQGAIVRYYSIKNEMPWGGVGSTLSWTDASTGFTTASLQKVIDSGELKSDFSTLAGDQLQKIRLGGSDQSISVCFSPNSKSFRSDNNTKFDLNGISGSSCSSTDNPYTCYWCVE